LLLALLVLQAYPNSGDEYGYTYVTETLRHGRLWNQAYPAALRDVLQTFYIGGHGDQRLSQYAPGWPVILLPFAWAGMLPVANPVIGLLAAAFLVGALRCLPIPRNVRLAALILGIAAPFTLFNNASFFSHPLTAAALTGMIWLDLRDSRRSMVWNRVGVGAGLSVLLATRYELGLTCAALIGVDGLAAAAPVHRLGLARGGWRVAADDAAACLQLGDHRLAGHDDDRLGVARDRVRPARDGAGRTALGRARPGPYHRLAGELAGFRLGPADPALSDRIMAPGRRPCAAVVRFPLAGAGRTVFLLSR
jgi:hypothetical protein